MFNILSLLTMDSPIFLYAETKNSIIYIYAVLRKSKGYDKLLSPKKPISAISPDYLKFCAFVLDSFRYFSTEESFRYTFFLEQFNSEKIYHKAYSSKLHSNPIYDG